MLFTLRTPIREMVVEYERAKSILISSLVNNGRDIELVSDTHYFDKDLRDIVLKPSLDKENNENNSRDTRLPKSKKRNKV